jgi:hypothetical protein
MNWHAAIGIISTLALCVPVVLIIAFKLYRYNNYLALLLYCLLAFIYNLMTEDLMKVPRPFERGWGIVNNLLDAPLMLLFLMPFSKSQAQLNRLKIYFGLFLCFEIVVLSMYGLTVKTITLVMGPGLAMTFIIAFVLFINKTKQSLIHPKAIGKAFIAAALTFAYGCFVLIYLMHYVFAIDDIPNIFLIYYLVTIIYCSLLAIGLIYEKKRIRKMEELLITRKELIRFFSDETTKPLPG